MRPTSKTSPCKEWYATWFRSQMSGIMLTLCLACIGTACSLQVWGGEGGQCVNHMCIFYRNGSCFHDVYMLHLTNILWWTLGVYRNTHLNIWIGEFVYLYLRVFVLQVSWKLHPPSGSFLWYVMVQDIAVMYIRWREWLKIFWYPC